MKQHFPDSDIVKQIVKRLGPPRRRGSSVDAVERAIETLRVGYGGPRPDVASIRKAAKNLHKALEPLSDATPILIKGRGAMQLQEFRSALDWLERTDGPSPKFDATKYCAALFAYRLVNEISKKPPTGTEHGQVRDIAGLLYSAISDADELADLKHQVDSVCRNRRYDNEIPERRRRLVIKEGKVHEAYLDEARATQAPGRNDRQTPGR